MSTFQVQAKSKFNRALKICVGTKEQRHRTSKVTMEYNRSRSVLQKWKQNVQSLFDREIPHNFEKEITEQKI